MNRKGFLTVAFPLLCLLDFLLLFRASNSALMVYSLCCKQCFLVSAFNSNFIFKFSQNLLL